MCCLKFISFVINQDVRTFSTIPLTASDYRTGRQTGRQQHL